MSLTARATHPVRSLKEAERMEFLEKAEETDFNAWHNKDIAAVRRIYSDAMEYYKSATKEDRPQYARLYLESGILLVKYYLFRAAANPSDQDKKQDTFDAIILLKNMEEIRSVANYKFQPLLATAYSQLGSLKKLNVEDETPLRSIFAAKIKLDDVSKKCEEQIKALKHQGITDSKLLNPANRPALLSVLDPYNWETNFTAKKDELKGTQCILDRNLFDITGVGFIVFAHENVIDAERMVNIILSQFKSFDVNSELSLADDRTPVQIESNGCQMRHESDTKQSQNNAICRMIIKDKLINGKAALMFVVDPRYRNSDVFAVLNNGLHAPLASQAWLFPLIQEAKDEREFQDLRALIRNGHVPPAVLNQVDSNGNTPLMLALRENDSVSQEVALVLIQQGADVTQRNRGGVSILTLTAKTRNSELFSAVLASLRLAYRHSPAELQRMLNEAFHDAMDPNIISILMDQEGVDVTALDGSGNNKLHYAISHYGNLELVKLLLEKSSSAARQTLLRARIQTRLNYELLADGPQIGDTAIHMALKIVRDRYHTNNTINSAMRVIIRLLQRYQVGEYEVDALAQTPDDIIRLSELLRHQLREEKADAVVALSEQSVSHVAASLDIEYQRIQYAMRTFVGEIEQDEINPQFFANEGLKKEDFALEPVERLAPSLLARYKHCLTEFARVYSADLSKEEKLRDAMKTYINYEIAMMQLLGWQQVHDYIQDPQGYVDRSQSLGTRTRGEARNFRGVTRSRLAFMPLWEQELDYLHCATVPDLMDCAFVKKTNYKLIPYKIKLIQLFFQLQGLPHTPELIFSNPSYKQYALVAAQFFFSEQTTKEQLHSLVNRMQRYMVECERVVTQMITNNATRFAQFRELQKPGVAWPHGVLVRRDIELAGFAFRPQMIKRGRCVCDVCAVEFSIVHPSTTPMLLHVLTNENIQKNHKKDLGGWMESLLKKKNYHDAYQLAQKADQSKLPAAHNYFKQIFDDVMKESTEGFKSLVHYEVAKTCAKDDNERREITQALEKTCQVLMKGIPDEEFALQVVSDAKKSDLAEKLFKQVTQNLDSRERYKIAENLCHILPGHRATLFSCLDRKVMSFDPIQFCREACYRFPTSQFPYVICGIIAEYIRDELLAQEDKKTDSVTKRFLQRTHRLGQK